MVVSEYKFTIFFSSFIAFSSLFVLRITMPACMDDFAEAVAARVGTAMVAGPGDLQELNISA